jgi:two-component system, NtrC family, sensor histidine kinase KinB
VTLRAKLILAQAPLLLALIVLGFVGSYTSRELARGAQAILRDNFRSVLAAQHMGDLLAEIDGGALFRLDGRTGEGLARIAEARRAFDGELVVQEGNVTEVGEAAATSKLRADWQALRESLGRFAALPVKADAEREYFDALRPAVAATRASAAAVLDLNQDAMVRKSDLAQRSARRLNDLLIAAAALGCLLGVVASGLLTTRLLRPLGVLSQAARRLGEGDSQARAVVTGGDELARVAAEFNTMADRLQRYRDSTLGQLLAAHRSSQAVIDSLSDPVVVLGPRSEILHLNAAAEGVLALRADTGLAAASAELRTVLERLRDHVFGGKGVYLPKGLEEAVRTHTSTGERRFLPRATPVYSEQGEVIGASIVLQDVTRLLSFDELRNDLVATVAHQFRTPLTSLRMAIHLLNERAAGSLTEKQADLLFAAREDCDRLQSTVDELLDLSRIQAGKLELRLREVDVESLARVALEAQRSAAELAEVELRSTVLPGQGELRVDPDRIALVFANLLGNAIGHSAKKGEVVLGATSDAQHVRFEVTDHGPGVPREYRQAIFEKYFQLPGSQQGGAGLGLSIAREVVRAHGGEIGVDDSPEGGARFWFSLPRS